MGSKRSKLKVLASAAVALVMAGSVGFSTVASAQTLEHSYLSNKGKYYSDYDNIEEVFQAAKELNGEIVSEGALLLKNDGTLPLNKKQDRISIFGVMADNLQEGVNGSVIAPNAVETTGNAFRNAGFEVNETLEKAYAAIPASQRDEGQEPDVSKFGSRVEQSLKSYNGAAVVVLQRVDCQEDKDFSTSLTGNTTNGTGDYDDLEHGNYALNEANDGPRELQDEVDPDAEFGDPYSWEHKHSSVAPAQEGEVADENGNVEVKHGLQLTKSEIELLDYVKARFDKVIVMFNSSTVFEAYNLEKDPDINGIVWFGRPGIQETGITAVAKIISGEVNPSGGASAEWMRDFTADPTWQNASSGRQFRYLNPDNDPDGLAGNITARYENGLYTYSPSAAGRSGLSGIRSVENEEGIYLGYKYYETVYSEIVAGNIAVTQQLELVAPGTEGAQTGAEAAKAWHDYNVVYPFGYGLSYTDFTFEMGGIYQDKALNKKVDTTLDASLLGSTENNPAQLKQLYVPVTVTNTGGVAGKQAVEIYVTAPYITDEDGNGIQKSYVKLVGFEKTGILLPGRSETVVVKIDTQDLASFDYNDANGNGFEGWEMEGGEYTLHAMSCSSVLVSQEQGMYDSASFTLDDTATMRLDNYSDNISEPLFSDPDERDYSIREGGDGIGQVNADPDASMTIMSRYDMIGTFPKAQTINDLTYKDSAIEYVKSCIERANGEFGDYVMDDPSHPWTKTEEDIPENWTQADADDVAARLDGKTKVQLAQMAGVPENGSILIDGQAFTWDDFMNQLSLDEIKSLISGNGTPEIKSIGKPKSTNADRPLNLGSTFTWADEPLQAATFNKDLIHRMGEIVGEFALQKVDSNGASYGQLSGWWGPGFNTNRSPFSGRTKEYYSQDSVLAGYIGAASVKGAQEKGCNVYIKHFAFHDQEASHAGSSVWMDEQTMRENYLASFKRIFQEGEPSSVMFACWRIGLEQIANSYDFMTTLLRDEWGWHGENASDMVMGQRSTAWENPQASEADGDKYDWPSGNFNNTEMMLRAGLGLPMSGTAPQGLWDPTGRDGNGMVIMGPAISSFSTRSEYAVGAQVSYTEGGVTKYYEFTTAHARGAWNPAEVKEISFADILSNYKETYGESPTQYYVLRKAAQECLMQAANSKVIENGVQTSLFVDRTIEMTQGTAIEVESLLTDAALNGGEAVYSIVSGTLPEGLTLDAATGKISGTPVDVGGAVVRIGVTVDGWVKRQANYTFTAESAWTADLDEAVAGTAYEGSVITNGIAGEGTENYQIASGALPEGLTLNAANGQITGTPTVPGEYTFTVSYQRGEGSVYESEQFTITVGGEVIEVEEFQVRIDEETNMLQYTADAGETWIDIISMDELKGADGQDGQDGKDGATPTVEINEDGYWVINGEETDVKAVGVDGADGAQGPQGPQGEKGDKGDPAEGGCNGSVEVTAVTAAFAFATVGAVLAINAIRRRKNND